MLTPLTHSSPGHCHFPLLGSGVDDTWVLLVLAQVFARACTHPTCVGIFCHCSQLHFPETILGGAALRPVRAGCPKPTACP